MRCRRRRTSERRRRLPPLPRLTITSVAARGIYPLLFVRFASCLNFPVVDSVALFCLLLFGNGISMLLLLLL